jgi:hypothetical protein
MKTIKAFIKISLVVSLSVGTFGCGELTKKKALLHNNDDLVNNFIGVLDTNDPNLMILAAYNEQRGSNTFLRMKLISDAEYDATKHQFLGRAYANTNDAMGFSIPIYEFYIPAGGLEAYDFGSYGYHYIRDWECKPGLTAACPDYASVPQKSAIAYVSSVPYDRNGVVPLYQYITPGGSIRFTINPTVRSSIILQMRDRMARGQHPGYEFFDSLYPHLDNPYQHLDNPNTGNWVGVVGAVQSKDCKENNLRSPWCR